MENEESKADNKENISVIGKMRENPWILSTFVLGILTLILIVGSFSGTFIGQVVSEDKVGQNLLNYFNSNGVQNLTIDSVDEVSGVYKVNFDYQGAIVPYYVTKDGKYAGSLSPVSFSNSNSNSKTQAQEIPKSDKPKVELFVMSYCPYGTQAEKGILPVVSLLGDKIDFKVRFVHYTLHGEKEDLENNRELCIREEQGQDKLNKYLVCILDSDNPNAPADVSVCEKEAGIDSSKLQTCVNNKADDYYKLDSKLSQDYGVQGSPTLIINGVDSSAGRNPQSYLDGVCDAFNNAPSECSRTLSSANPSAGFGSESMTNVANTHPEEQC